MGFKFNSRVAEAQSPLRHARHYHRYHGELSAGRQFSIHVLRIQVWCARTEKCALNAARVYYILSTLFQHNVVQNRKIAQPDHFGETTALIASILKTTQTHFPDSLHIHPLP